MARKHIKKLQKNTMSMVGAGIGMGVGMSVMSSSGASTTAVGNIAGAMPTMGKAMGAGAVIGSLGLLMPKKKKRRR